MVWKPHVTVAAVIEKNSRFLLIEEETSNGLAFNQPAGHLEKGESIISAVKREVSEETAWKFDPEYIVSIQLWRKNPDFPVFLRVCFAGKVHSHHADQVLDDGIIATHWLTHEEITEKKSQLRSPLVLKTVETYLSGEQYPLSLLKSYLDLDHE
jgi:8-oxo-dGTP pyrophosphatase MutT (NUDIX family)